MDPVTVLGSSVEGDILTLDVEYEGCSAGHPLGGCWNGMFNFVEVPGSAEVQLELAHHALAEDCGEVVVDEVEIDLSPLRDALDKKSSEPISVVLIDVAGLDEVVEYPL